MRVVDRATFLSLPAGTLYAKVETPPTYDFGAVEIKGETVAGSDFYSQRLIGDFEGADDTDGWIAAYDAMVGGESKRPDFDIECRDGLFDRDQLFAVFELEDLSRLIERLQCALTE